MHCAFRSGLDFDFRSGLDTRSTRSTTSTRFAPFTQPPFPQPVQPFSCILNLHLGAWRSRLKTTDNGPSVQLHVVQFLMAQNSVHKGFQRSQNHVNSTLQRLMAKKCMNCAPCIPKKANKCEIRNLQLKSPEQSRLSSAPRNHQTKTSQMPCASLQPASPLLLKTQAPNRTVLPICQSGYWDAACAACGI